MRPGARPAVLAGAGQSGAESGRGDAVPESDAGVREQAGLDRSLRPVSRPRDLDVTAAPAPAPAPEPAPAAEPRAAEPARPQTARAITPETLGVKPEAEPKPRGLLALLRPKQRSPAVDDKARRQGAARRQGSVCGDPEIQGVAVGKVAGTLKGCGVVDAVRIQSVAGIGLSTHAVMDCKTAQTLRAWVDSGLRPSVGRHGGGVAQLRVAAHYACRGRNNQKGARISEHGKGRAIDISAFRLRDGTEISVLKDWGNGTKGQILRNLHRTACGPFGTVLGPNSDRFHKDHFHLDTARYRSGSYCR
nr:extensin family protein [Oceanicola sp. 22II-s10i]